MSAIDAEFCRDRMYPSRHVTGLPRDVMTEQDSLSVDYARVHELPVCRQIVEESAQRGDNVGDDEYCTQEDFDVLLGVSEVFVVKAVDVTKAFIVIQPCTYTRTWDTCWATVHIFYSADLDSADRATVDATKTVFSQLLQLSTGFVRELDLGYTDCLIYVASGGPVERLEAARRQGFVVIATIPSSVNLTGLGIRDDLLLAKTLSALDRPRRPREDVLRVVNSMFPDDEVEAEFQARELPTVKFLPQQYVFRNGLEITVRTMRRDEDSIVYGLMKAAADKGEGYGVDEFPTFSSFRAIILSDHPCFVFEETATGKVVGWTSIGDSWYTRSRHSRRIFESSLVIAGEFQGRGFGKESTLLELALAVELGYAASVNDWLGSNRRMDHIIRQMFGANQLVVGRIPRGTFTTDVGWDDQTIIWHDVRASGIPTFTEVAEESRGPANERRTSTAVSSCVAVSKL